ncbi:hypothetical protein GCM10023196_041050 [Actinoallomurus vinaceus]|uniref:Secreted protein n=1 Tax=Actinoallomurus vinaceus TaxID=1080074 RepID=A0ABP8UB21_9ACTN
MEVLLVEVLLVRVLLVGVLLVRVLLYRARRWSPSALDVRSAASVTLSATPLVQPIPWVRWYAAPVR